MLVGGCFKTQTSTPCAEARVDSIYTYEYNGCMLFFFLYLFRRKTNKKQTNKQESHEKMKLTS